MKIQHVGSDFHTWILLQILFSTFKWGFVLRSITQAMQNKYINQCLTNTFPIEKGRTEALSNALIWPHIKYLCNSSFVFKKNYLELEKEKKRL